AAVVQRIGALLDAQPDIQEVDLNGDGLWCGPRRAGARRADRDEHARREEAIVTALTRRAAIAGGLCTFTLAAARSNPDWPDRPISMVHGFPAGGPTDLMARIVAG